MSLNKDVICIYHANCLDGFASAYVVRLFFGEGITFHAATYGSAPPDVTGKQVVIVDFSYSKEMLEEMGHQATTIVVLDHHKTAVEALKGFESFTIPNGPLADPFKSMRAAWRRCREQGKPDVAVCFDMKHSGAMLAWMFFFPFLTPPKLIQHIEDRDLWEFKLEDTDLITMALFSYPYDFEVWRGLMERDPQELLKEGQTLKRKYDKDVEEILAGSVRFVQIAGYTVPAVNANYLYASTIGHILGKDYPFAAVYSDNVDHRIFSLRSDKDVVDTVDVSEIAKQFGGGGHKTAAGFKVPFDHPLANGQAFIKAVKE